MEESIFSVYIKGEFAELLIVHYGKTQLFGKTGVADIGIFYFAVFTIAFPKSILSEPICKKRRRFRKKDEEYKNVFVFTLDFTIELGCR